MQYCSASTTTTTPTTDQGNGIIKRVLKKVGFTPNSKARIRVASHMLYESVADKINYLAFFNDFNMPNTFNSWFLVTELHVWMLLLRSMAEGSESGEDGRFLRNCIVEALWSDVNTRAKKLGANNPSRTRQQIEELSEQFQAALIAYDEGIMSEDRVLAAALWRRFFALNCDDYEKIERLVKYVRRQVVMLDNLSRQDFLIKPKIPWQDLNKIHI
ncbi:ubiquinol-cytochrome-c reductase complex assembly factor 1 [Musca domestica]|uniref:Ubiquinol-cytochrome-c reductase complex assembly factor 1 n=1 Tax=Musca domestica TaxID=7370 RepID=A0A9J7I2K8_MUSDO|nr:ubiquinol-cytochrome-c reductase complex assembly factor 1 [Musca domestica]